MSVASGKKVALILTFVVFSTFIRPAAAQIVSSEWVNTIEDYAQQVDLDTTAEIVVCVVPALRGHGIKDNSGNEITDIIQLGVYIFNEMPLDTYDGTQMGIGKKGKDNGVLVLVTVEEQQWRIEVGYGLEGDLTDIESNRIAQQYLVPQLKQGNYGEALYDTVVALGNEIPAVNQTGNSSVRGYYYYETNAPPTSEPPWWTTDYYGLPLWIIIVLALLGVTVPIFGGKRSRGGSSGGGGSSGRW